MPKTQTQPTTEDPKAAAEDKATEDQLAASKAEAAEAAKVEAEAKKKAADEEKASKREAAVREKAEAEAKARQALIDSGELLVTGTHDFSAKESSTKTSGQVKGIIDLLKAATEPQIFTDLCEAVDAKYPEDLQPAMHALEHTGQVRRFEGRTTGDGSTGRRQLAFLFVQ